MYAYQLTVVYLRTIKYSPTLLLEYRTYTAAFPARNYTFIFIKFDTTVLLSCQWITALCQVVTVVQSLCRKESYQSTQETDGVITKIEIK